MIFILLILIRNTDDIREIHNVPTILCFKNGEIVDTLDGYIEYEEIEEKFNELLTN